MMPDDDILPSLDEVARRFVAMLEARGARFTFRDGTRDWHLDLNGVPDMTRDEAAEIAAGALDIRGEIRRVLLLRRGDDQTIH